MNDSEWETLVMTLTVGAAYLSIFPIGLLAGYLHPPLAAWGIELVFGTPPNAPATRAPDPGEEA